MKHTEEFYFRANLKKLLNEHRKSRLAFCQDVADMGNALEEAKLRAITVPHNGERVTAVELTAVFAPGFVANLEVVNAFYRFLDGESMIMGTDKERRFYLSTFVSTARGSEFLRILTGRV